LSTQIPKSIFAYFAVGNEDGVFRMDALTGQVILAGSLDYESVTSYSLLAIAEDKGTPSFTSTMTILVSVVPVNEFPPVITSGSSYNVSEDEDIGKNLTSTIS
jgi:hypothetical protein